jgi:hypothetical protein
VALWVAPELADPLGALEAGEHQDVEQLGTWSRTEGIQARTELALELVGSHGRRLRRRAVTAVTNASLASL